MIIRLDFTFCLDPQPDQDTLRKGLLQVLPTDVLGLVLYKLKDVVTYRSVRYTRELQDVALTGLTCHALHDAAKLASKALVDDVLSFEEHTPCSSLFCVRGGCDRGML